MRNLVTNISVNYSDDCHNSWTKKVVSTEKNYE